MYTIKINTSGIFHYRLLKLVFFTVGCYKLFFVLFCFCYEFLRMLIVISWGTTEKFYKLLGKRGKQNGAKHKSQPIKKDSNGRTEEEKHTGHIENR